MWGRKSKADAAAVAIEPPSPLTQAMRQARVEVAERSSVVVDLRDAELARLELLNEALSPLFAEIPGDVDLFDRGISRGDTPRLWIDSVAHVAMGRDKRIYRFLLDTRVGRRVLTESHDIAEIVPAVTTYVARRLVERQRALDEDPDFISRIAPKAAAREYRRRRWRSFGWLVLGFLLGSAALIVAALIFAARS
jgi:hypothetical protein